MPDNCFLLQEGNTITFVDEEGLKEYSRPERHDFMIDNEGKGRHDATLFDGFDPKTEEALIRKSIKRQWNMNKVDIQKIVLLTEEIDNATQKDGDFRRDFANKLIQMVEPENQYEWLRTIRRGNDLQVRDMLREMSYALSRQAGVTTRDAAEKIMEEMPKPAPSVDELVSEIAGELKAAIGEKFQSINENKLAFLREIQSHEGHEDNAFDWRQSKDPNTVAYLQRMNVVSDTMLKNEGVITRLTELCNEEDYDNLSFLQTLSQSISLIQELKEKGYYIGLTGEESTSEIASIMNEELIGAKKHMGIEQENEQAM